MRRVVWLLVIVACFAVSCNKNLIKHKTPSHQPQAVYIGSQIEHLKTDGILPSDDLVLIEVTTFGGKKHMGRLYQITDKNVILSDGYELKTAGQRTFKEENLIELPKVKIAHVKLWQS